MKLTPEQVEEVLNYLAFKNYNEEQKKALRAQLSTSNLSYMQISALFSDYRTLGIIPNLVEKSHGNDTAEELLGKLIENIKENINPDYDFPPISIIQNLIGNVGAYDETIEKEATDLIKQHVEICKARIITSNMKEQLSSPPSYGIIWASLLQAPPQFVTLLAHLRSDSSALDARRTMDQSYTFFDPRAPRSFQQEIEHKLIYLNKLLTINSEDLEARLQRAQLLALDKAIEDYTYILERDPNNIAALLGRAKENNDATIYGGGHEQIEAALADYQRVLELDPQNKTAQEGIEQLRPSAARPN
ncbi:MAG: hypothetical protein P4L79_08750 [Legionella sp.]|uniref:hypothetical protein n=1 Tax=Legionella sp. TaxID=459 RepID=UPI002841247E|nr:hypothetical protein [Legionella sp.]